MHPISTTMGSSLSEQIKNRILSGDTLPTDFTLHNLRGIAEVVDIHAINTDEFINYNKFLTHFFEQIENIAGLERADIRKVYQRFHDGLGRFVAFTGPDESYGKEIESLTELFSSISKSQVFIKFPLNYDHITIFQQLGMALKESLTKQISHNTEKTLKFFFQAARESISNANFLRQEYSQIARSIAFIGDTCFSVQNCNHHLAFSENLRLLGDMTRELDLLNMSYASNEIFQHVLKLQKNAIQQLTPPQITEAVYLFLNNAYPGQNQTAIASQCAELFPNHCHLPESTTESSTSMASTNEAETTTIANDQPSNLPDENNLPQKLASGAIVGFTMGVKDELIDALCNACVNAAIAKKYSPLAVNSIKTTFWLINTFSSTALPLLYSYIYNIMLADEEKDPLNTSQLIISTSICFSLEALSAATYLLPKNSNIKNILDYIKLPLIFSFIYATSENIGENALVWITSSVAGVAGKGVTKAVRQTRKGEFFREKKQKQHNPEEGMELISSSPSLRHSDTSSDAETSLSDTSLSSNRSQYYFLTMETLLELRQELTSIEKNLHEFLKNCQERIHSQIDTINKEGDQARQLTMQAMLISIEKEYDLIHSILNEKLITVGEKQLSQLDAIVENLNDPIHDNACKGFNSETNIVKDPEIVLSNSFLNQLKNDLEALKIAVNIYSQHDLIQKVIGSSTSIVKKISVRIDKLNRQKIALEARNPLGDSQTTSTNPNNFWGNIQDSVSSPNSDINTRRFTALM